MGRGLGSLPLCPLLFAAHVASQPPLWAELAQLLPRLAATLGQARLGPARSTCSVSAAPLDTLERPWRLRSARNLRMPKHAPTHTHPPPLSHACTWSRMQVGQNQRASGSSSSGGVRQPMCQPWSQPSHSSISLARAWPGVQGTARGREVDSGGGGFPTSKQACKQASKHSHPECARPPASPPRPPTPTATQTHENMRAHTPLLIILHTKNDSNDNAYAPWSGRLGTLWPRSRCRAMRAAPPLVPAPRPAPAPPDSHRMT